MTEIQPYAAPDIDWPIPTATTSAGWDRMLTRRLRVLLHTTPLHDLRRSDSLRDQDLRHYDSLTLTIKAIDLIIEHTGLDHEVGRETLIRALTPLLTAMDHAAALTPDSERHARIIDKILSALRNDGERRHPFQLAYQDIDDQGTAVARALEFRLLADHFHPTGEIVLRLSNEAVNLYLNALELDIEDAQAAAEAVVQSQLARGRFDEAVQSAKNARWQSVRYQQKVVEILRETQRDVGRVDWREEVPRLLNEALQHITARLATEESILKSAEDRLEVLPPSDARATAVAEVVRLIRDCRLRHVDLHDQLMRARNLFLDEQARQSGLSRTEAASMVSGVFPFFAGAQSPKVLSLTQLLAWQLQPRRELYRTEVEIVPADLATYDAELTHYPPQLRLEAETLLASTPYPVRVSALLEAAHARRSSAALMELLVLLCLQHYAPEDDNSGLIADYWPSEPLDTAGFFGDDLEIHRVEASHGDAE